MHCYIITVSYFIHKVGNTTIFIYYLLLEDSLESRTWCELDNRYFLD